MSATPRCPVHHRAASTAYQSKGCRCPACLAWRRSKRRPAGAPKRLSRAAQQLLWAEADAAFRIDAQYIVAMAEMHRESVSA